MNLRQYQADAVQHVRACWKRGARRVCLVAPTGAGKTVMGEALCLDADVTLWLTHTKDLVEQTWRRLRAGGLDAHVLAAGWPAPPHGARVLVASIQTLVERSLFPLVDRIIVDECHHFVAQEWRAFLEAYPFTATVGLTATPQRGDGQPLGDVFDELVVSISYSELTTQGFLVPVRILRPKNELDRGIARDPVDAYLELGEGRSAFMFCRTVELAHKAALSLTVRGVPAACIEANTPKDVREGLLRDFSEGRLRVLTNMFCLTEGVDVPVASCCVIGRSFGHVGTYLQAGGRVLRPHVGKKDALILDLPGVSHRFSPPNQDRLYSLEGEGIHRCTERSLRICMHCGMTWIPTTPKCPRCGKTNPTEKVKAPRILNAALEEVYAGADTPAAAKQAELVRLAAYAKANGYEDYWVRAQYKALFNEDPPQWGDDDRKKSEYRRLLKLAKERGYKEGFADVRYRDTFGAFPPRHWKKEIENA